MEDEPTALIFSVGEDSPTLEPVIRHLDGKLPIVVVLADEVARGEQQLLWHWRDGAGWLIVDGTEILLARAVGWWRKPHWYRSDHPDPEAAKSLEREVLSDFHCMAAAIPENRWLNSPTAIHSAQNKVRQWSTAHEHGLKTPPTLITNEWECVAPVLGPGPYAFKQIDGGWSSADLHSVAYTARIGSGTSPEGLPFPGLVQPFLVGSVEWRVTVVDGAVYAARIRSPLFNHRDWRLDQLYGQASFQIARLEPAVELACANTVRSLGLHFGAIDLIEDNRGDVWFLEVNPNGQYEWLDNRAHIAVAIADSLCSLAQDS